MPPPSSLLPAVARDSADRAQRVAHGGCVPCHTDEVSTRAYVYSVGLPSTTLQVRELRDLLQQLLARKIAQPSLDINSSPVIEALSSLILAGGL